jgi:hypothetical protein
MQRLCEDTHKGSPRETDRQAGSQEEMLEGTYGGIVVVVVCAPPRPGLVSKQFPTHGVRPGSISSLTGVQEPTTPCVGHAARTSTKWIEA